MGMRLGNSRAEFRRQSNVIILMCLIVLVVAYVLVPFLGPGLSSFVFGVAGVILLVALFLRVIA